PLAAQCTNAKGGRTVDVGPNEEQLARARARQHDPDWNADYRPTRPTVQRKTGQGHVHQRKLAAEPRGTGSVTHRWLRLARLRDQDPHCRVKHQPCSAAHRQYHESTRTSVMSTFKY